MLLTRIARAAQNIAIPSVQEEPTFQQSHSFEMRLAESQRILEKYPDRIPVICERLKHINTPEIDKKKFLVPSDLTVGQFIYVVRKRIKLTPEQAIYLFVDGMIPPTSALLSNCYENNRDSDGFLYVKYCCENTFGGGVGGGVGVWVGF